MKNAVLQLLLKNIINGRADTHSDPREKLKQIGDMRIDTLRKSWGGEDRKHNKRILGTETQQMKYDC